MANLNDARSNMNRLGSTQDDFEKHFRAYRVLDILIETVDRQQDEIDKLKAQVASLLKAVPSAGTVREK